MMALLLLFICSALKLVCCHINTHPLHWVAGDIFYLFLVSILSFLCCIRSS